MTSDTITAQGFAIQSVRRAWGRSIASCLRTLSTCDRPQVAGKAPESYLAARELLFPKFVHVVDHVHLLLFRIKHDDDRLILEQAGSLIDQISTIDEWVHATMPLEGDGYGLLVEFG